MVLWMEEGKLYENKIFLLFRKATPTLSKKINMESKTLIITFKVVIFMGIILFLKKIRVT